MDSEKDSETILELPPNKLLVSELLTPPKKEPSINMNSQEKSPLMLLLPFINNSPKEILPQSINLKMFPKPKIKLSSNLSENNSKKSSWIHLKTSLLNIMPPGAVTANLWPPSMKNSHKN
jgi:hypothetical protein